jgi:hypothetical protein
VVEAVAKALTALVVDDGGELPPHPALPNPSSAAATKPAIGLHIEALLRRKAVPRTAPSYLLLGD